MFDKLVVSTSQTRRRRTAKFFVGTSITYLLVVVFAFALSIYLETPKLAASSSAREALVVPIAPSIPPPPIGPHRVEAGETSRPNLMNYRKFDELIHHQTLPVRITGAVLPDLGKFDGTGVGSENGVPHGLGVEGIVGGSGKGSEAPPKPPDPPRPAPASVPADNKPLRVGSVVLQGKVIERRVPTYPEMGIRIRLQGVVAVEVIISPEGRVESVRAVSGHPMLTQAALDAARAWRFAPTMLNGVPVRVTGVITFVFKLNE